MFDMETFLTQNSFGEILTLSIEDEACPTSQ